MKSIIHINQNRLRSNTKHNTTDPPIIVRTYKGVQYGNVAEIKDKHDVVIARLLYNPEKPLSCGARIWLETELKVEVK